MQAMQHKHPRIIALANQKGGVGKTTTTVNLATALCAMGQRVLLVDMDAQGNATTGLGINKNKVAKSVYDVLGGTAKPYEIAIKTKVPNLSVIPATVHLSGAEVELATAKNREGRLRDALRTSLPYDYVLIDSPPSLNFLTLNSLVAAHAVIIPMQCEFYAMEGLTQLHKTIQLVKKRFNPDLSLHGIALTMVDRRNRITGMVEEEVRKFFKDKVYKTVIPRNVRLSEAPSHGLPAIVYDMKCKGAQSYIALAKEVITREKEFYNQTDLKTEVA